MTYSGWCYVCLVVALVLHPSNSFSLSSNGHETVCSAKAENSVAKDRRAFLLQIASTTLAVGTVTNGMIVEPALASGGATAGGAYLLSAKQRYNDRVIKGIKGFLALESSLKGGSVEQANQYFAGEQVGTWGDVSTAGYLLANAFRRSSTTAPDSLPSVKKWKAFVKELDAMQKKLQKKDAAGTLAVFNSASVALDAYLAEVELPPVAELK